jgi:hypothetical protein
MPISEIYDRRSTVEPFGTSQIKWITNLLERSAEAKWTGVVTARGMLGQLERGYQVSPPPFGFKAVRDRTPKGHDIGSRWEIESKEAEVILKMYSLRQAGKSFTEIACELNILEAPTPCPHRSHGFAHWRPGTVRRILANKIYKGVFMWKDRWTYKSVVPNGGIQEKMEFERQHLRIVSDEVWEACNSKIGAEKSWMKSKNG